jgi:response regulator of citrate/malate metabolism
VKVLPVPDARHELNTEQVRKAEHRRVLSLRISVESVGLDVAFVVQQSVENVDRLPNTTRNEVTEQRDIHVRNVVVLFSAGISQSEIARRLSIGRTSVRRILSQSIGP